MHDYILKEQKIVVHCFKGISRSPTLIIAYLIKYNTLDFEEAFKFLKDKSKNIDPNFGFLIQLRKISESK